MTAKEIRLDGWNNDGLVFVRIEDKSYTYRVDGAHVPRLVRNFRHSPWRVLNEMKRTCSWWAGPDGQPKPNTRRV